MKRIMLKARENLQRSIKNAYVTTLLFRNIQLISNGSKSLVLPSVAQ